MIGLPVPADAEIDAAVRRLVAEATVPAGPTSPTACCHGRTVDAIAGEIVELPTIVVP